jgi:uncharacterized protein involved in outer membrane biogenesis
MTWRRGVGLAALATLIGLAGVALGSLPEVVRREAAARILAATGRPVSIEDVDLNLFTGRVAFKGFRIGERDTSEAFLEFERLDARVAPLALAFRHLHLREISLTGPTVRVIRTGATQFNFSDLLGLIPPADAPRESKWTVTLDRVELARGSISATDRTLSPPREWRLAGLSIGAGGLTTGQPTGPGQLALQAKVGDMALAMDTQSVRLTPGLLTFRVSLEGLDVSQLHPYLPPDLPVFPRKGKVGLTLVVALERAPDELKQLVISGDVRVEGLTLTRADEPAPFATAANVSVGIKAADLLARAVTLGTIELAGLDLRVRRDRDGAVDLLRLVHPRAAAAPPPTTPSPASHPPLRLGVEQVKLDAGTITFLDEGISPAREWRIREVTLDARGLSAPPDQATGRLDLRARVAADAAPESATVVIGADAVRWAPLAATVRASVDGLELAQLGPYLPPGLPVLPPSGTLRADLTLELERDGAELRRGLLSGEAQVTGLVLTRAGETPFATVPQFGVAVKQADLVGRTATLTSLEASGLDLRLRRGADGTIDLLGLLEARPARSEPRPAPSRSAGDARSGAPSARGATTPPFAVQIERVGAQATVGRTGATARGRDEWQVTVERLALTKGAAAFEDEAVSPRVTLALTDVALTMDGVSWPSRGPGKLELSTGLPGGGRLEIKGSARLRPFEADVSMTMRDAPIDPYQPYFPFKARLSGRFGGDSRSQFKLEDGKILAVSQGTGWTENLEVRSPDSATPVIRGERLEFRSVNFSWPNYARVARVTMKRPVVRVERMPDGTINLQRLFAPSRGPASARPSGGREGKASEPRNEAPGLYETMLIDFGEILVEDGVARFTDRTTRPAFSQDVSGLALRVREVSNTPGQQARFTGRGLIGGKATLELNGQISPLASEFHADVVGDLRDFPLASVNPYAEGRFGWVVRGGVLDARLHYRLDEARLTGTTDAVVRGLQVAPSGSSAEVEKRVGLPLDTIVGLIKDQRGEFRVSVPVHGTLRERQFDWGAVIWTAVQNSLVNVVAAPFKLVGRLFTGGTASEASVAIEPVTFTPGSAAIVPAMEGELLRAADFLRGSPGAGLSLVPVATREDLEALKAQELTERIEGLRRERGLADSAAAVAAYFEERLPGTPPPPAADEQLAQLRAREPAPEARVSALLERRVEVVREALSGQEGIQPERLVPGAPATAADAPGFGRVQFVVVAE